MKKYLSEFLGTFMLVFTGTGAVIANHLPGVSISHEGISTVFGLIVMAMIYATGDISGAHLNPAVTFGFALAGRFSWKETVPYILAQTGGAVSASFLWKLFVPGHPSYGATLPHADWTLPAALSMEVLLTFLLMLVILRVSTGAKEKGIMAGVAIGGTVALSALFAGPLTGASMNPARSLGPALAAGKMSVFWLYLAGPVAGASLAVLVDKVLHPVQS